MKGNAKLIDTLNALLSDELTAISQLVVHAEMCSNWGYEKLHNRIKKQAIEEMTHADWLIERILFLEGAPVVKLNEVKIGKSILEIFTNDEDAELEAIRAYNAGVQQASEAGDESTGDLLTTILKMEEGHHDWAKKQRTMIQQMGLENYLAAQAGE
ncbi:MAG: bacterioferritin [Anaerolineales bacterium]|nr:bacterioferritin [Anaerolineales bacterium]